MEWTKLMPFTSVVERALLGLEFGDATPSIPSSHYIGLFAAASWTPGMTCSSSTPTWVVPSNYQQPNGQTATNSTSTGRLFYCTTTGSGTTGTTEPNWPNSAGGVTAPDSNSVVWTEASYYLGSNNTVALEPSGNNYARVPYTNNSSYWSMPASNDPAYVVNNVLILFNNITPSPWGQLVGAGGWDRAIGGSPTPVLRWWGLFSQTSQVATIINVQPNIPVGALTINLT